ncbi:MAG TPA: hypothetical protein VGM37_06620 [Armatimonadota bacterium]|jgi:hypothetical protein
MHSNSLVPALRLRDAFAAVLLLIPVTSWAKPSIPPITVTNVTLDKTSIQAGQTVQVAYTLSQPASSAGILIELLTGATVAKSFPFLPPAVETTAGAHTALLDTNGLANASYTVRVTAPSGSTAGFINVTDTANPLLHFYNPRGVDVNRITGSPAFGRIYVSEGAGGATTGRTTVQGIYMLNSDLTDPFPDVEPKIPNSGANGGEFASSANSPFRVTVGPDSQLYIADWSDPHAGLFISDPDGNQVDDLIAFPNPDGGQRSSGGLTLDASGNQISGSTSSVWVEGTGASRKLFVTCEDMLGPLGNDADVWEYDIPTGQTHWGTPPTLKIENMMADGVTPYFTYTYQDIVRDSAGNFYVTDCNDGGGAVNEAYKFDSAGKLVTKLPDTGARYFGIAIDDAHNRILISGDSGQLFQTDKSFTSVRQVLNVGGGTNRDVAFDAAGWAYVVNSTNEQLYILAGPGEPVTGGAASAAATLTVISPTPGDVSPVGSTGLFTGPFGHKYGDGKVDVTDAVYVLKIAAGLASIP